MFFDNQKFWSTWVFSSFYMLHRLCSIDPAKLAKFSGNEIMCRNSFSIYLFCLIHFCSFWSIFQSPNSKARVINGSKKFPRISWREKNFLILSGWKIKLKWIKKCRAISFDGLVWPPLQISFSQKTVFRHFCMLPKLRI